jgi:hypothetical protein
MLREKTENWPNPSKGGGEGGWGHPFGKTDNMILNFFRVKSLKKLHESQVGSIW